jgi:hypothetical protein
LEANLPIDVQLVQASSDSGWKQSAIPLARIEDESEPSIPTANARRRSVYDTHGAEAAEDHTNAAAGSQQASRRSAWSPYR